MKGQMPKGYYDYMYDVEGLTNLNAKRTKKVSTFVKKVETLVRKQKCQDALHFLRRNLIGKTSAPEADMLALALTVKSILFKDVAKDVNNASPKHCALVELKSFLKLDLKTLEYKMVVEEPVHEEWNSMKIDPRNEKDVNRFYKETNSYIYELMAANNIIQTLFTFGTVAQRMQRLGISKVLDYGGGAGTLSILLKKLGFAVTFADLKSKTADFAKWRFKQRNLNIPNLVLSGDVSADLKKLKIKKGEFDCILCTEVIEHVNRPLDLVKSFSESLSSGGVLVISESCEYTEQFSSHLESNKKYGGKNFAKIMKKYGFVPLPVDFFIPQQIFIKL